DTGQETLLNQEIPPIPGMRVLHLTANHEFRDQFNGVSIIDPDNPNDPRLLEIGLSGAHSDIGGGYGDNGIEALSLEIGHRFLRASGVPIADIPAEWTPAEGDYVIHDSLVPPYTDIDGDRNHDFLNNPPVEVDGMIQPVLEMDLTIDGSGTPIQPFTDSGGLSPDYILAHDTPENREAFAQSDLDPEFVGVLSPEFLQAQQDAAYYRFLKQQAVDSIVRDTGLDAADILDLDVPGNPNAPGYHFDPRLSAADGGGGGWDGGSVHRQADGSIVREVDGAGAGAAAVSTMMSLYAIKRAVDDGDSLGALAQGVRFVDSLSPGSGGSGQGVQAGGAGKAGQFAAAIDFARAVDGGDTADILVSGASLVLSTAAGRAAVDSLFGVQAGSNVPYVAYL